MSVSSSTIKTLNMKLVPHEIYISLDLSERLKNGNQLDLGCVLMIWAYIYLRDWVESNPVRF